MKFKLQWDMYSEHKWIKYITIVPLGEHLYKRNM